MVSPVSLSPESLVGQVSPVRAVSPVGPSLQAIPIPFCSTDLFSPTEMEWMEYCWLVRISGSSESVSLGSLMSPVSSVNSVSLVNSLSQWHQKVDVYLACRLCLDKGPAEPCT